MKPFVITLAALFAVLAQAQQKMVLTVNGQVVGKATLAIKIDASGNVRQTMKTTLQGPNGSVEIDYDTLADKNGRPISKKGFNKMGSMTRTEVTTFGPKSVSYSLTVNGKTTTKQVPLPKGSIVDVSMVWFVKSRPKPGTEIVHFDFQSKTGTWKKETTRYVGPETVPGTKMKGHHLKQTEGDMWVDDKGMPIRLEQMESGAKLVLARAAN